MSAGNRGSNAHVAVIGCISVGLSLGSNISEIGGVYVSSINAQHWPSAKQLLQNRVLVRGTAEAS